MKLLALTIGGNGQVSFPVNVPGQIAAINALSLQSLVRFGVAFLFVAAILLAFFFFLFGGVRWIMSQGDKKQLDEAQKTLKYALVGLVVVFLSFFIVNLIGFVFGVSLLGK